MTDEGVDLRWGVEKRLAFLDACLFWSERLNRADLVRRFDISVQQASADLARYLELAPGNARYDRNRKTYVREPGFRPVFGLPDARALLHDLEQAATDGRREPMPPWAEDVTAECAVPRMSRKVDEAVLQALLAAIRERQLVFVQYASFSHPGQGQRWIAPHAFVDDGDRWHVRAYCETHNDFRDFVVSRIHKVMGFKPSPVAPSADKAWHSSVTLKLAPNPRLNADIRKELAAEHEMLDGVMSLTIRTCFAFYVSSRLGLDLVDDDVPSFRKRLVLLNEDEVRTSELRARAETAQAVAGMLVG